MSEIRSQATSARDELAEKIQRWLTSADKIASAGYSHQKVRLCESMGFDWHETIAALQKALPRTVNSAAELDALAEGSVILVDAGRYGRSAWQKHANGRWCEASHCEESMTSTELRVGNLPTTVLFTPGEAG